MATVEDIPTDLALEIGEDLDPAKFLAMVREFFALASELMRPSAGDADLTWRVKVREGSNIVALDPLTHVAGSPSPPQLYTMMEGTDALVAGRFDAPMLTDAAIQHAKRLSDTTRQRGGAVPVRIWIKRKPFEYGPQVADMIREEEQGSYHDYGTLEGTLNAIADKSGAVEIKVTDPLWPQAIPCKVTDAHLPDAMAAFRKRVELSGLINYNRVGRPTSIRVESLSRLPDDADLPTAADVWGLLA